ncbi:VanW family protein [Streptosporangium saharense]|uniref:Vancomycin resistance protein YoaR n=1 Tax=Streptosporangium saharense TaxID=1706840 RepID=A0A7W7QRX5_9ACTN|nr:VanW family protein [Streptosporangium saharense]MBB4918652.1 vancomycin resistance protein YoaR [Streptosporangium saharense]
MRNGASTDPPTDPFSAVPLPSHPVPPGARDPSQPPGSRPKGRSKLPPGVSPDIFGPTGSPGLLGMGGAGGQQGPVSPGGPGLGAPGPSGSLGSPGLPPPTPKPEPWRVAAPQNPAPGDAGPPGRRPSRAEGTPPRRRGRGLLLALVLLVLGGLAYVVPAIVMAGKMLPGTSVRGVDIGGLTATEAADRLRDKLAAPAGSPMTVRAAGKEYTLDPEEAGLEFDVVATIDQAPSDFPSPGEVWRALTGTDDLGPKVSVDPELMKTAVRGLARKIDLRVRDGAVTFKDTRPVAVAPRDGRRLEQKAAADAIAKAFLGTPGTIDLPVSVIKPRATPEAVEKATTEAAKALSGPVTLVRGDRRAQLTVGTLAAHLTYEPDDTGDMHPVFDAKGAVADLENGLVDPGLAPKEPTFEIVGNRPKLVSGRKGQGVDTEKLADDMAALLAKGGERTVQVTLTTVEPRLTDAQARALGIKEKISEFTTPYVCCPPRVTNIRTLARIMDGYIVKPGETFSLNGVIGERDTARGFVPAPMIQGGRLVDSVGGGISQFVTTMYNAVFFGGLEDVQHVPHEFYISRYPAGRESTVSWPEPDFRWRNDSKYGVLVKTSFTNSGVTVAFWSTKRYDIESISSERYNVTPFKSVTESGPKCIPMEGQQGFTIDVWRIFKQDGEELKRTKQTTIYRPELNLKCVTGGTPQTE